MLQQTHSTTAGLSRQDAKHSLREYGANSLKQKHKSSASILSLNLFKTPIILIIIFAAVRSIFLQDVASAIFWDTQPDFYKACLCNAQLRFANGFIAEAVYGKEETFWAVGKHFYHLQRRKSAGFYSRILSINAGRKSAQYQSKNAVLLACSRHGYGVKIFVKL